MKNEFNWDVKTSGILDINGNPIKGYNEITRDDNGKTIAVMKDSFTPMTTQNFTETAHKVCEKIGGTGLVFREWETDTKNLGAARPVITAEMTISEPLEIAGSKMNGVLTLGVGFDGSRSFFIGHRSTYLRCTNQFNSIVKDFKTKLTKNHMVRVEDIIKNIGLYNAYEQKLYENFVKFQDVKIDERLVQECVARIAKLTDEEKALSVKEREGVLSTQKLNKIDDIMASVRGEMAELGNNAWGVFNGITHYSTHVMPTRGHAEMSSLFGNKAEVNKIAYNFCLELLENN